MSAQIVNLKQWEADHPPLVRLVTIQWKCVGAWWRMVGAMTQAMWRF